MGLQNKIELGAVQSTDECSVSHSDVAGTTGPLRSGEVAIVGAGPGDPELLTLKAYKLLLSADVVLYDYLVAAEILALVKANTQLVCVGKRAGKHKVDQQQTNQWLIDYARQGKKVVRLKGGDPFMFGRGGEEIAELVVAGICFQVVPGITSASGASAYAGLPLTHRDYAQSVTFVTGHQQGTQGNGSELDWHAMSRPNQTLVIYMGVAKAPLMQKQLLENGRAADTPVAIIAKATQPSQKIWVGRLDQLSDLADDACTPALIIVGEVVSLAEKQQWLESSRWASSPTRVESLTHTI